MVRLFDGTDSGKRVRLFDCSAVRQFGKTRDRWQSHTLSPPRERGRVRGLNDKFG